MAKTKRTDKPVIAGINFLERHPFTEQMVGLDKGHVIVDAEDWRKAIEIINDLQSKNSGTKLGGI